MVHTNHQSVAPEPSLPLAIDQGHGLVVRSCGQGPLLLLIHGTGATHASWLPLVPYLSKRFRILMPDLPGHGDSPQPSRKGYTLDGMVECLRRFMASHAEPALVIGHSAGAAIAARSVIAGHLQPQALVALNPALLPFPGLQQPLLSGAAKVLSRLPAFAEVVATRARDPQAMSNLLSGVGSRPTAAAVRRYQKALGDPQHVSAVLKMMAAWDLEPLARQLKDLQLPVLLLGGLGDRAVSPNDVRELAVRLPAASARLLAGAGHLMHEEMPDRIAAAVLDWYGGRARSSRFSVAQA